MLLKLVDNDTLVTLAADTSKVGALVINEVVLNCMLVEILSAPVGALLAKILAIVSHMFNIIMILVNELFLASFVNTDFILALVNVIYHTELIKLLLVLVRLVALLFDQTIFLFAFELEIFNLIFHELWEVQLAPVGLNFATRACDVHLIWSQRVKLLWDMVTIFKVLHDL